MQDLSKLFGQGLLSLQVLHGSVWWAGQCLQQAAQGILCKHMYKSEIQMHRLGVFISLYSDDCKSL